MTSLLKLSTLFSHLEKNSDWGKNEAVALKKVVDLVAKKICGKGVISGKKGFVKGSQ